jgi:hypothetical protein
MPPSVRWPLDLRVISDYAIAIVLIVAAVGAGLFFDYFLQSAPQRLAISVHYSVRCLDVRNGSLADLVRMAEGLGLHRAKMGMQT